MFRGHTAVVLDTDWQAHNLRSEHWMLIVGVGILSMTQYLPQVQMTERFAMMLLEGATVVIMIEHRRLSGKFLMGSHFTQTLKNLRM